MDLCRKTQASKLREKPRLGKNPELHRPANYTDQRACAHTPLPRDKRKPNTPHHTQAKTNQKPNAPTQEKTPAKENQKKTQHEPLAERRANNWSSCGRLEKLRPWKALQQTLEESPYTNLHAGPSRRSERADSLLPDSDGGMVTI